MKTPTGRVFDTSHACHLPVVTNVTWTRKENIVFGQAQTHRILYCTRVTVLQEWSSLLTKSFHLCDSEGTVLCGASKCKAIYDEGTNSQIDDVHGYGPYKVRRHRYRPPVRCSQRKNDDILQQIPYPICPLPLMHAFIFIRALWDFDIGVRRNAKRRFPPQYRAPSP